MMMNCKLSNIYDILCTHKLSHLKKYMRTLTNNLSRDFKDFFYLKSIEMTWFLIIFSQRNLEIPVSKSRIWSCDFGILYCINKNILYFTRDKKGKILFQIEIIVINIYKLKYYTIKIKLFLISSYIPHKKTFQFWKFFFMLNFLAPDRWKILEFN